MEGILVEGEIDVRVPSWLCARYFVSKYYCCGVYAVCHHCLSNTPCKIHAPRHVHSPFSSVPNDVFISAPCYVRDVRP